MNYPKACTLEECVEALTEACYAASKNAGWWENADLTNVETICTKLCLIHSEISEAMEGLRKDKNDDHLPDRKMFEVELADALIRIADLAGAMGLDLGGAVCEKMEYNRKRQDHKKENRNAQGGKKF